MTIQPWVGRTDGEGIERIWAFVCGCAASTKEMGPGSRHNILDDQFHYHNWCKFIAMGISLTKKRMRAQQELKCQMEVHLVFTNCLPNGDLAQKWMDKVTAWKNDMDGSVSSYMMEVEHETEAVMLHQLQEEERQEAGWNHVRPPNTLAPLQILLL
ncbi:uncharacterized protein ARMOST_06240 [Armillaria ostoyae]|uniref:Uncharacterized protein n=1 Tax=Armillaria ostoyae TaxID=47428 RepID=A0A284R2E9_ARMOS|nr:uncharacterized protein ARMOST_06240 [Armillaria ostoyae]